MFKGNVAFFSDPIDIANKAPFGIAKEHLKVPTNEERIAVSKLLVRNIYIYNF